MRFDTHRAGAYLVSALLDSGGVSDVWHDGNDILLVGLPGGESVMIYMIERPITLSEVKLTLERNTQLDIYTAFVFWCDMLLPRDGSFYHLDDWMEMLLPLYGERLYGFEVIHGHTWIFPVYFQGEGQVRRVLYEDNVNFSAFGGGKLRTDAKFFEGDLLVADFSHSPEELRERARKAEEAKAAASQLPDEKVLQEYYTLLGVPYGADRHEIRKAYRKLAMEIHPDVNPTPEAHRKMQEINIAYMQIIAALDRNL